MIIMLRHHVLSTMQASVIIGGIRHCRGRKDARRWQRSYRESQTGDDNGSEPRHISAKYVVKSW
ncbi:hypothetical protein [Methyloceanibacter sp.]|uniref:hypothetical protein n=1 Tax=Methyloceanibacter sp. TaxID=1965321 RepID=UPI002BD77960|nr:hypothetical protein [Methyloceanibacter sp.]HML90840.1 hypothetical protein [Methyloceanibacter sp.]